MLDIVQVVLSIILCVWVIKFVCCNFVGCFVRLVVGLVLCALALVLVAFLITAIEITGWLLFGVACLFCIIKIIKWIVG